MNTLKAFCLGLFLLFDINNLSAQESGLDFRIKHNTDRSISIEYVKSRPGRFTVLFQMKDLEGSSSESNLILPVNAMAGTLVKFKPRDNKSYVTLGPYRYNIIRGGAIDQYNSDFTYLLPYDDGTKVQVIHEKFDRTSQYSPSPESATGSHFITGTEQNVTAVRKGQVVVVTKFGTMYQSQKRIFRGQTDKLVIEHPDGTLAVYLGLNKDSIKVQLGQTVFPGTIIGTNSKTFSGQYGISLIIYYLKEKPLEQLKEAHRGYLLDIYGYVKPKYYTLEHKAIQLESGTEYTSQSTPALIRQELSKKEIKLLDQP
jgi:hypothetical protein